LHLHACFIYVDRLTCRPKTYLLTVEAMSGPSEMLHVSGALLVDQGGIEPPSNKPLMNRSFRRPKSAHNNAAILAQFRLDNS